MSKKIKEDLVSKDDVYKDFEQEEFVQYSKDSNQIEPVPVPLPTEIPEPPNLSQLPQDILHSGTVETLIGQNDDLMARLKVTLRRQSILEQDILNLKKQQREIEKYCDNLENQNQILKEKDQQASKRQIQIEDKFLTVQEDLQLYEIRYAELSEKYEIKKTDLVRHEKLNKSLRRKLKTYSRRLKKWVRPLITSLRSEIKGLGEKNSNLVSELEESKLKSFDLKERTQALIEQIQTIETQNRTQVADLVQHYEKAKAELEKVNRSLLDQIQQKEAEEVTLKTKAQEATFLSNENIRLSRLLEETRQRNESDLGTIQNDLNRYRAEAKTYAIEVQELRSELDRTLESLRAQDDENKNLTDQLESLQLLWAQKQKAYSSLEEKYVNLQLINRDLAQTIENRSAGPQGENSDQNQFAIQIDSNGQDISTQQKIKDVRKAQQSMQKIEGLIAEIQSGCSPQNKVSRDNDLPK